MSASGSDVRVYHVNPWRQYRVWLIFGPLILFILGVCLFAPAYDADAKLLLLLYAGGFFLIPLSVTLLTRRTRLELTAHGLRLRQTGYTLETSWSNVIGLRLDSGREGFITAAAIESPRAARLASAREVKIAGLPIYDREQQTLLAEHRFIPFEAFAWHLRHGSLRSDIATLAPHLKAALDELDTDASRNAEKLQRRETWTMLALLVSIVIGATILASSEHPAQEQVLRGAATILMPLFALRAAYSAWSSFHLHAWWLGMFFVAVTVALVFLSVGTWVEFASHWH